MKISNHNLRLLIESVLLEGFKDDQDWVIKKAPELEDDIKSLKPVWIAWIISRFGDSGRNPRLPRENHPFEEALRSVIDFSKAFDRVATKWKSNETFRNDVEESILERAWKGRNIAPDIIPLLTSDEMELLMGLTEREKQDFKVNVSEEEMESDRVGKVGPWNLWMPTTRERSCKIAQYDPVTLKPKTTWCTARMAGSNAFYNYTGRPGVDMTLFYIIRDNPSDVNDWLSVGFVNGKPDLSGKDGWVSVNRDNRGLTPEKLRAALGEDLDEIMQVLTEKNKSLGGRHPAREKIETAARSIEGLKYLTQGLSKEDAEDMKLTVVREPNVSSEVLTALSNDVSEHVRVAVARNERTPPDALRKLTDDKIAARIVAVNPSAPPDALEKIVSGADEGAHYGVASNKNAPPEALRKLYHKTRPVESATLRNIASNPNLPEDLFFEMLERGGLTYSLLQNKNPPKGFLEEALKTASEYDRVQIAKNPGLSLDALASLANDKSWMVRVSVAENPRTPRAALESLLSDGNVRPLVASNPNLSADMLAQLASDPNTEVRANVARNAQTSPETLANLARDPEKAVRLGLITNKSTPIAVMQKLTKDRSRSIKQAALFALERRGEELNESRLRQLIRRMI